MVNYFNLLLLVVDEKSSFWDQLQKDIEKNMTSDDNTAHPWLEDFNSVYNTPRKV